MTLSCGKHQLAAVYLAAVKSQARISVIMAGKYKVINRNGFLWSAAWALRDGLHKTGGAAGYLISHGAACTAMGLSY